VNGREAHRVRELGRDGPGVGLVQWGGASHPGGALQFCLCCGSDSGWEAHRVGKLRPEGPGVGVVQRGGAAHFGRIYTVVVEKRWEVVINDFAWLAICN